MARDLIAMLDGLGDFGSVPRDYTVEPGNGQNYVGGSAYPGAGFPTLPSGSYGLAGGLSRGMEMTVEPGNGQNYVGGSAYPGAGFPTLPSGSYGLAGQMWQPNAGVTREGYNFAAGPKGPALYETGLAEYMREFDNSTQTVEPGGGANYAGGAAYPGAGWPTLPSGAYGLAGISAAIDRTSNVGRVIAVVQLLLRQYGFYCVTAGDRMMEANNEAARYADWLRNGYGDPALRQRAQLIVLRSLARGLQSVIVTCSGSARGPADLQAKARAALRIANAITGDPTNA